MMSMRTSRKGISPYLNMFSSNSYPFEPVTDMAGGVVSTTSNALSFVF